LGGIGEALYATASGILVAIIALAFYQLFSARVRRVGAEIEALGSSEIAAQSTL
jgi:biopolymer transport protein ExbB/TolQ